MSEIRKLFNLDDERIHEILNSFGVSYGHFAIQYPRIYEKRVKPSELGLSSRELFYWIDKKIINVQKSAEGQSPWVKLNLLEVIWLKIALELRRFKIPFSTILKVKQKLDEELLGYLMIMNDDEFENFIKPFPEPQREITKTIRLLKLNSEKDESDIPQLKITLLEDLVQNILILKKQVKIHICISNNDEILIVCEGQQGAEFNEGLIEQVKEVTHLTLNLKELISDYLVDDNFEDDNVAFGLISEKEMEIIKALRDKEICEITIKRDQEDVLTLITTKKAEIRADEVTKIKRMLVMNEYNEVRVVLRNNKHIYLENKTKRKL